MWHSSLEQNRLDGILEREFMVPKLVFMRHDSCDQRSHLIELRNVRVREVKWDIFRSLTTYSRQMNTREETINLQNVAIS